MRHLPNPLTKELATEESQRAGWVVLKASLAQEAMCLLSNGMGGGFVRHNRKQGEVGHTSKRAILFYLKNSSGFSSSEGASERFPRHVASSRSGSGG
jgi:hypothetical protein